MKRLWASVVVMHLKFLQGITVQERWSYTLVTVVVTKKSSSLLDRHPSSA